MFGHPRDAARQFRDYRCYPPHRRQNRRVLTERRPSRSCARSVPCPEITVAKTPDEVEDFAADMLQRERCRG